MRGAVDVLRLHGPRGRPGPALLACQTDAGGRVETQRVWDVTRRCAGASSCHGLRRTFGFYTLRRGVDMYRLEEIIDYADLKTPMEDARLRPASLRLEVAALREEVARLATAPVTPTRREGPARALTTPPEVLRFG